jgi:predicted lipid-binding transport protein (Tim44 family)
MFTMPIDIVFFAIIAAFIAFKLYKVLGRPGENDDTNTKKRTMKDVTAQWKPKGDSNVIDLPVNKTSAQEEPLHSNPEIAATLASIRTIDRNFTPEKFTSGAKKAFEMVINAYAKGDKDTLSSLLSPEVYQEFADAIEARAAAGEELQTTLIAIISSDITAATLTKNIAHITVKFVSDQVNITRNKNGEIISGDLAESERIEDSWTFSRNVEAVNPNWTLIATSSQS